MSELYDFDQALQRDIIAMVLLDSKSCLLFADVIKPEYFENPIHQSLLKIIFEFFHKYERIPMLQELAEEISIVLSKGTGISEDEYLTEYSKVLVRVAQTESFDYIKDKVIEFAKFEAMKSAIINGARILKTTRDYPVVRKSVEDAMLVGENRTELGTFYFPTFEERLKDRREGMTRRDIAIRTNFKSFDDGMGGGIAPAELGIIMGPSKRGKTITLVNFAVGHMWSGHSVVHIIFEMSEQRLTDRYDSKISGIPVHQLKNEEGEVRRRVDDFKNSKHVGQLVLKHFVAHSASPWTVEAYLQRLKLMSGFDPSVVILDYLGLMVPSSRTEYSLDNSGRYFVLGEITKDLLALAQKHGYAIWLAHQSTRGSKSKQTVDLDDSADSFEPMRDADIIITLNQSDDERDRNPQGYRLYIAGGREIPDKRTFDFVIDFDKTLIQEKNTYVPEEER